MIKSLANWGDHVWIKQHLRIKRFLGTSENAVKTQVWIAIAVYVLAAIIKKRMKGDASLYTLLQQIFSLTLFEKTPMDQLLYFSEYNDIINKNGSQLNMLD